MEDLDFDLEAIRARYEHERNRRLRADGEGQYIQSSGEYAKFFVADPNAGPEQVRPPIHEEVDVLMVGGGHSGLMLSARLREAGVDDIRIVEMGADFGGTWYWNRYPGAQCDVDSYIYLPLLEETGYIPSQKYADGSEIYAHARRIAQKYDLYSRAAFRTTVQEMRWDEAIGRWIVTTDRGDIFKARFVTTGVGVANRPKLPGIPGIQEFQGHMFHTARWDYAYTGGDSTGGLTNLQDKSVALIGTGATAVQIVPHLGRSAKQLFVFQRTPSSVDVRGNKPTDSEWVKSLTPGWQKVRQANFDAMQDGAPGEDLVNDMWTDIRRFISFRNRDGMNQAASIMLDIEIADHRKMHEIRERAIKVVQDKKTAEALQPWYRRLCKRPCFHDEYLLTFNRPNVSLVDTSNSLGVERITSRGVVAGGVEYPVDCIIFSTGFEITTSPERRIGMKIQGRAGQSLFEHWAKGPRTFQGHSVHGFPNWFYIGSIQTGATPNFTSILDANTTHVAYIISEVMRRGRVSVEATAEAEARWVDTVHRSSTVLGAVFEGCTPGTFNNEGGPKEVSAFRNIYGKGMHSFRKILTKWREEGSLEGMELR